MTGKSVSELKSLRLSDFLDNGEGGQAFVISPEGEFPMDGVKGVIKHRGREITVYGLRDISERLETHQRLDHLISHDPLTGLLIGARSMRGRTKLSSSLLLPGPRQLSWSWSSNASKQLTTFIAIPMEIWCCNRSPRCRGLLSPATRSLEA